MLIVDSQVHIWGANTPERPWPGRAHAQRDIPLGHEELLREMNAAGVQDIPVVHRAIAAHVHAITLE